MPRERRPTPEERYLERKRAELAVLEGQLADRELELHTLRGGLLSFEKQYETMVTERYAQLDELKLKIAEKLPARAPQEQGSLPGCGDSKPPRENATSPRPRRRPPASPGPKPPPPQPPPSFNPAESLKRLYRDVAKSLHPDLADSDENRAHRHLFMVRANEAYEAGNETALLAVFQEWEQSAESVQGVGPAADLVRVIRKIAWCEERLVKIAQEIEQLQTSGLFGMKMMAEEAAQFERDLLAEMTARLDAEIAAAKEYLARLEAV